MQGMLYITTTSLYFYSPFNDRTLLGKDTKLHLPFTSIEHVNKTTNKIYMPNSIKIILHDNLPEVFLTAFIHRDLCFDIIERQRAKFKQ